MLVEVKSHAGRLGISRTGVKLEQISFLRRHAANGALALIFWRDTFVEAVRFQERLEAGSLKTMSHEEFQEMIYLI